MKKVFLTALSGLPAEFSGGPNKVIYYILNCSNPQNVEFFYLSKDYFLQYKRSKRDNFNNPKFLRTKIAHYLYQSYPLYRKFFSSPFYLKKFFNKAINSIGERLNDEEWDILHSHDIRTLTQIKNKNGKIIQSIHSKGSVVNDMKQIYGNKKTLKTLYHFFENKEKSMLEYVDVLTFPSKSAKEIYFRDLEINSFSGRVEIIYNGIDIDHIKSLGFTEEFEKNWNWLSKYDYRILTIGSHIPVKNIDKILRVFEKIRMKNKSSVLIIIGSGPLKNELKKLAKELNLGTAVHFIDFLDHDNVLRLMKKCNVYISLSERVIFDYVILEALACGMNVFASNNGGNIEVINGQNGCLVEIDDINEVSKTILDSDLKYSEEAIKSVERFSVYKMVEDYLKLYEQ
jgi:glycosyltransferase involved in cell wall biosynthesis